MKTEDKYLLQCKTNYFQDITPANPNQYILPEYKVLIEIGRQCIKEMGIIEFSYFFQESQYFIELWTSHIILEYHIQDTNLKEQCIKIIKKYSNSTRNLRLAEEEKVWLNQYLNSTGKKK